MMLAKIAVEKISYYADEMYSYSVPKEFENAIDVGSRVIVPFGKGDSPRFGIVIELEFGSKENLKEIIAVLDESPLISFKEISIAKWMKKRYFCSYFDAIKLMLPPGMKLNLSSIKYKVKADKVPDLSDEEKILWGRIIDTGKRVLTLKTISKWKIKNYISILKTFSLNGFLEKEIESFENAGKKCLKSVKICNENIKKIKTFTSKQSKVIDYLKNNSSVTIKQICYFTGVSENVVRTLLKKGAIMSCEISNGNNSVHICSPLECKYAKPKLSVEQEKIFKSLYSMYEEKKFNVSLLHGITGSGKTEVLLSLADKVIESGKSVIFMVPEIALTAQFIDLFKRRYGNKAVLIHSLLSDKERSFSWHELKKGKIAVVLGTRSAIFAPVSNLGLAVIDEEHEFTYKSDSTPRFNAKDIAKYRCFEDNALLVLSSATPSLESYYNAKIGKYKLYSLKQRYGSAILPKIKIVDMNHQNNNLRINNFSTELIEALVKNLKSGKQSLVFLNRRGYNPFAKCISCSNVILCPNCSVSLNYHKANGRLMCHYCDYSREFISKCPECGSEKIVCFGVGTQKAEDYLATVIPEARILRMDSDIKNLKNSYEIELKKFADGEYDILLGTQMISKGFNFPNLTLVGVLSADQYMYNSDFRSYEKTFSILTQVVGRAGRGKYPGEAIIQTFTPESEFLQLCSRQDYETFFEQEIAMRRAMLYPPFVDVCVIGFVSKNEFKAKNSSLKFFECLKHEAGENYKKLPLRIFLPCAANLKKISGNYRYRIIIKCRNNRDFLNLISDSLKDFYKKSASGDVRVFVDINPGSIL